MESYYPHNRVFNDVVFDGRNKAYGAYYLRHLHNRHMVLAIFLSIGFLMLLINTPNVIQWVKGFFPAATTEPTFDTEVFLTPPPTYSITPPQTQRMEPKQRSPREQIQFVDPDVRQEEETFTEAVVPTNVEVTKGNIGTTNTAGETEPEIPDSNQHSGTSGTLIATDNNPAPFFYAEQMPSFVGGQNNLYLFLSKHTRYPALAREHGIEGKVIVQFVVTEDGEIENVRVVRGIGFGCDEEAIRAITIMPKWIPGKHNGRNVPVTFTLPIVFDLN